MSRHKVHVTIQRRAAASAHTQDGGRAFPSRRRFRPVPLTPCLRADVTRVRTCVRRLARGAGQDGGGADLGEEPGCHRVRGGPGREGQRAPALGAVPAGRAGGQHAHAQGPGHGPAPGLRLRGVPERGGRRLRHQDHEHDQALRQTHPGQQGLGPQQEPGRGRQHLHRQPGPRDRREAALRHLQRLRGHPADPQDHEGPRHGQLQGLRLHQLRQLRRLGRGHRGHERAVPVQPAHHRLLRLQEGLQGRAARLGGRAAAGGAEPPVPGRPAPPALRRRAAAALRARARGHRAGAGRHPARPASPRLLPAAGAASRGAAPRDAPGHAPPADATGRRSPRATLGGCPCWGTPPSPTPLPARRDAPPRNATHAGAPRPTWHGAAPPRTTRLWRAATPPAPPRNATPRTPSHGAPPSGATFWISNGSPRAAAAPRAPRAPPADATPRLQRAPQAPPLRLPEGPSAPSTSSETPWSPPPRAPAGTPALRGGGLSAPHPSPALGINIPTPAKGWGPSPAPPFPPHFFPPFVFIVLIFLPLPISSWFSSPGSFPKLLFTGFCWFCMESSGQPPANKGFRNQKAFWIGTEISSLLGPLGRTRLEGFGAELSHALIPAPPVSLEQCALFSCSKECLHSHS